MGQVTGATEDEIMELADFTYCYRPIYVLAGVTCRQQQGLPWRTHFRITADLLLFVSPGWTTSAQAPLLLFFV